jgi:hypothetical protein
MKKTIIAASAVMLILIALLVMILCLPQSEEKPEATDSPTVQVMFDTNHVEHLEMFSFCYEGKETVSISRTKEGGWQITDRPGLPIDPVEVTLMLRGYERMLALRLVSESLDNPAEYGLDTPSLEVTVADHGSEKTYFFGDENKTYEGYYCTVKGSGAVYLLDVSYFTAFEKSVDSLLLAAGEPDFAEIFAQLETADLDTHCVIPFVLALIFLLVIGLLFRKIRWWTVIPAIPLGLVLFALSLASSVWSTNVNGIRVGTVVRSLADLLEAGIF